MSLLNMNIELELSKLQSITFNEVVNTTTLKGYINIHKNKSNGGRHSIERVECSLSYRVELSTYEIEKFPVQIVWQLRINNNCAQRWGCIDNLDNSKFTKFFLKAKSEAYRLESEERKINEQEAGKMYSNL